MIQTTASVLINCLDVSIDLVLIFKDVLDYQPKYTQILTHIHYYGITNIKYAN